MENLENLDLAHMSPAEVRALIREGKITCTTAGMCDGYAQANLVVLPKELAYDFLLYAQRNPKACPVLEVSDVGSRNLPIIADGCDIARDIPRYWVYEHGVKVGEYTDVEEFWRDDLVSFLLGCSYSFEADLIEAGIEMRHQTEHHSVPMYTSNIACKPAGVFHGNTVVSMRPMTPKDALRATIITSSMPNVHGSPVHLGDPSLIGISDINHPDFGVADTIRPGEIPVFWCCGVTPQDAVMQVKPDFCITHAPGHMLITDVKNSALKV